MRMPFKRTGTVTSRLPSSNSHLTQQRVSSSLQKVATMRILIAAIAMAGGLLASPARAQPPLGPDPSGLTPDTGPPQTLVTISGLNLRGARVVWDAGEPFERELESNLRGADMFSVPVDAKVGDHWVTVSEVYGGRPLRKLKFTVSSARLANPKPRLDHISLVNTKFEANGMVMAMLYVQGANIDVGAEVFINGVKHVSHAHKVLINKLFVANPEVLAYPIRHYLSRVVVDWGIPDPPAKPIFPAKPGSEIHVQIVNEDGQRSDPRTYSLPLDVATLDSDGDGIPDVVEDGLVYHYGDGGTVDVRALGASRFRKDVLVEVDIMEGLDYRPQPELFVFAQRMFASAPIINPFDSNGINLIIDATGSVEEWDISLDSWDIDPSDDRWKGSRRIALFSVLKGQHFTRARRGLFHYALWGGKTCLGCPASVSDGTTGVSDGLYVADGAEPPCERTPATRAVTFVHELGHNLGLRHGGADDRPERSPTYWSVMSYAWHLRTTKNDGYRKNYPTCTQMYYASPGAVEKDGALPNVFQRLLDYSEGMGPTVSNGKLDENLGVCGQPIDWNKQKSWCDDDKPCVSAGDHADWANLNFGGPRSRWPSSPPVKPGNQEAVKQLIYSDGRLWKKLRDEVAVHVRSPVVMHDPRIQVTGCH
jgi:hypothetical protein